MMAFHFIMMEEGIEYDIPTTIKPKILSISNKKGFVKFIELPFLALKIRKYIRENNIDTVMSFLYRPNYLNLLAKLFGSHHKAIINIRSTTSRYKKEGLSGKINLFLIKALFNKADLIISNSRGVENDLKKLLPITTNTKVIYNPIDKEYIDIKKDICQDISFYFNKVNKYIISIGRLIPLKRNLDLITAFYKLQEKDKNLKLIFLGDGILKDGLIKNCKSLNLEDKVYFLGNVSNPFYYLNKADLFVLTSETEGFPNVLVEAMTCGIPVISSDCKSGPREILNNEEYGLLYPVGDINILIEKMNYYLYKNKDIEKIKNKNLERIKEFNIKKIMRKFKEVLEVE